MQQPSTNSLSRPPELFKTALKRKNSSKDFQNKYRTISNKQVEKITNVQ
jgi:disulfide oxidoreductase YuzD